MKWVTRERPKIDRIACPWLIERFIEKQPEFLYVPADKVLSTAKETGAIPYDIPDVKFSHVGEKCSFDAFIAEYKLSAPGLDKLADIVRGADTSRLDLTPQSAGLFAISLGLSHVYADDHEMLKHSMVLYAALALVFPVFMLVQQMANFSMGSAITSAVARAIGAGRREDAAALAVHGLIIAGIVAAAFTAVFLLGGRSLYAFMGGSGAILLA